MTDYMSNAPLSARKKKIYELSVINRPIPEVGIFDEPTRCYRINKQWARIVMGFASLLTMPELWKDAENDVYEPIQQILEFLAGDNCGMDCEQLNDCLEQSDVINNIINELNDLRDYVEYGDSTTELDTTIITDVFPYEEQLDNIGDLEYVGCDPDEIWGAVNSLVNYIDQTNKDFLQRVSSATNLASQVERAIAATPVIGWFPMDEAVGLVDWYANEANSAYLAVVDELLLQQTKCDLFCIALNNNPCGLNFADLINYFSAKVPASAGQFVDTLSNLILFAITGTFAGSDYFYYMSLFQLATAAIGEKFLNTRGKETYAIYAAAGKNSPDSDWSLFCDECPLYTYIEYDFTVSSHGFTSANGTWVQGQGWVATITEPSSGNYRANITIVKQYPVSGKIFAGGMVYDTVSNCGIEGQSWKYFNGGVEEGGGQIGAIPNGDNLHQVWTNSTAVPPTPETFDEIRFNINAADCDGIAPDGRGIIKKGRVWFAPDSAIKGIPSTTTPVGLPPNGSTSTTFWE